MTSHISLSETKSRVFVMVQPSCSTCDVNILQYEEKRTLAVFRDLCIRKQTTRAEVMRAHANERVNKGGFTQLLMA